jgi:general secretion pathway protein F
VFICGSKIMYYYKAVTNEGKLIEGTLARDSEKLVARELARSGLTPVYIGARKPGRGFEAAALFARRPGPRDRLFFTQELATLLNAGLPLDRALSICAELTGRDAFRSVIHDVLRELKGGKPLADSLGTHPEIFSDLYLNMVRAGEASGSLAQVMDRLAQSEQAADELRGYLISSLIYPALLALVGAGSVTLMLGYVIPKFGQVFQDSGLPLPGPTQALLTLSAWTREYGWLIAGALAAAIVGFRFWTSTKPGRRAWHGAKLRLPMLGQVLSRAETARFARTMATLIANGVPLVQSLRIGRSLLNNEIMAEAVEHAAQGVKRGEGLAAPLRRTAVFPPLAAHLLTVGEETGHLDSMFARMADIYDAETRATVKRATALFEPAVILGMGLLVGAMVLSMLLAIVSINDVPL